MANKRQKPVDQLQGHRKHPEPIQLHELPVTVVRPPCPDGLNAAAARVWSLFWDSSISRLLDPVDVPAVERYVQCLTMRDELEEELKTEGIKLGRHRAIRALLNSRIGEIAKFEERFGIGPLPRMRLGVAYGDADRALEQMQQRYEEPSDEPVWVEVNGEARQ